MIYLGMASTANTKRTGPGRPKKSKSERRTHMQSVCFSLAEWRAVKAAAARADRSMSAWAREILLLAAAKKGAQ